MKLKLTKPTIIIAICAVLTLGNSGVFAYSISHYQKAKGSPATGQKTVEKVVEQKIDITNPKKKTTTSAEQGKLLGEGQYKTEELAQSKIKDSAPAELVIAANEASGGHFVLALLHDAKIPQDKVNSGWTLNTIASDPMWAPGACSSKPTFLLQGKYIFIDDGKTDPNDKYNSYIVFNMLTGKYVYFGGANFTSDQGNKESIFSVVNENDKLVFYIDPADAGSPAASSEGAFVHTRGQDHGYVIRREIDPATMRYTDYSLPFTLPSRSVMGDTYNIGASYNGELISIYENYSNPTYFGGRLTNNSIALTQHSRDDPYVPRGLSDNSLDLKLDKPLSSALPQLSAKQAPAADAPAIPTTKFFISELGSHQDLQFLIAKQHDGPDASLNYQNYGYETPVIYNNKDGSVSALTDNMLLNPALYVPLGVF